MKIIKSIILLLFLLGVSQSKSQTQSKSLLPSQFKEMSEKTKGIIIDVRSAEEYNFTHIPNAIQIAVDSADFINQINTLDKNKNYFVYCGIGKRSEKAILIMEKEGFKKLYSLKGGFTDWKKEGLPVIKYTNK